MSCDVITERTAVSMPPKQNTKKIRIFRHRARYHTSIGAEITTEVRVRIYRVFLNAYLLGPGEHSFLAFATKVMKTKSVGTLFYVYES